MSVGASSSLKRSAEGPVPLVRYFDVVLLILAAPILLLIGVPAAGYGIAAGAWIALFFLLVWAERHHLWRVMQAAFTRRPTALPDDSDEPGSYRWAGRILVAGTLFLTTDDVHASYEELKARGVEFTEEPEERPYGIDSGFRDPSGNSLRLTEVRLPASV